MAGYFWWWLQGNQSHDLWLVDVGDYPIDDNLIDPDYPVMDMEENLSVATTIWLLI